MLNANLRFRVMKKVNSGEVGDLLTIHSIKRDRIFGMFEYRSPIKFSVHTFNWLLHDGYLKMETVEIPAPKERPLPLLAAVL